MVLDSQSLEKLTWLQHVSYTLLKFDTDSECLMCIEYALDRCHARANI